MKRVGLYLHSPVFSHGQLYVAFSRVSDPKNIICYFDEEKKQHGYQNGSAYTKNVVHQTILTEEIQKFKESEDYGEGPEEFSDGIVFSTLII